MYSVSRRYTNIIVRGDRMNSFGRYTTLVTNLYAHTGATYLSKKRGHAVKPWLRGDVLDIGCGGESSLVDILEKGQRYVGVDIQKDTIERLKVEKPECEFHCVDVEVEGSLVKTVNSRFDTIVAIAVIEHLKDPAALLQQCKTMLKPGGRIVITTPTPLGDKLMRTFKSTFRIKHEEMEEYSPHVTNFDEQSLSDLLTRENQLEVKCYRRFEFGLNQLIVASN